MKDWNVQQKKYHIALIIINEEKFNLIKEKFMRVEKDLKNINFCM